MCLDIFYICYISEKTNIIILIRRKEGRMDDR